MDITPKARGVKSIHKGTSPRIVSGGVARSDNHSVRRFGGAKKSTSNASNKLGRNAPRSTLPDIIKRGPINNRNSNKKIVGLSLQKRDITPQHRFVTKKRNSIESQKPARNTKARNAILNAAKPMPTKRQSNVPTFRMPNRNGSLQPSKRSLP